MNPSLRSSRLKSIATVCLSGTLPDKLEAAAAAGFDAIELFENDLLTFDGTPRDVRRMASDQGLAIVLFQPFRDFEAMPAPIAQRNLDRAERKFDIMEELGTDLILVCSNVREDALDDDARAAADLAELGARAARRGLRIGYEALAWGRHVRRWSHAWRLVQAAGHPAVGLILDSYHTLALGDSIDGINDLPGDRIFFVQLADSPHLAMDVLSRSRHFRNYPGQGDLNVTSFVRSVLATGYAGPLSLEVFNDSFRASPPRQNAVDGLRSLIWVEAEAGGPALPPAPELDGFAFAEFAVDAAHRPRLDRYLRSLGFRHEGQHRSKEVALYRQGRAHLVVNAEPDSAAAEYFVQHGPSICAFALVVDDVDRALARAEALLCPRWQERTGAEEQRIPGVRAPDGSLIYLINRAQLGWNWRHDFHPVDGVAQTEEADPAPLEIDHIAEALPPGALDRFILFYRTVFGMSVEPMVAFPDRFGLIKSRALRSPGGTVRLPLNVSDSPGTETGRFLAAGAGAGFHHIAFRSADVARLLQDLRAEGGTLLPIPQNYYDDLAASGIAPDAVLDQLPAAGLMFDADAQGQFRHAYAAAFEDRFFFEFLERRGYQGYGANNASVRVAAQARARHAPKPGLTPP
ncbi:bifunctional sugar phosphate isomerase/epimerase/4-hydroxyphenylpyruvate dioxygenase family protein [Acidisoma sp. 7E03]